MEPNGNRQRGAQPPRGAARGCARRERAVTERPTGDPAAESRAALRQANEQLTAERLRIAALDQEKRALEDEIALMERSAGRRLLLTVRGAALRIGTTLAHPAWTIGSAARALAARPPLRDAHDGLRHLRRRALPLRPSPPIAQHSNQPAAMEAIRWIGPMTIRHVTYETLLCHPTSRIEYSVRVRPGAE